MTYEEEGQRFRAGDLIKVPHGADRTRDVPYRLFLILVHPLPEGLTRVLGEVVNADGSFRFDSFGHPVIRSAFVRTDLVIVEKEG